MKNNKEIQNYKIFEVCSIQKKRWEGEIKGARLAEFLRITK